MRYKVYWTQSAVDDLDEVYGAKLRDARRVVLAVRLFGRNGAGDIKKLSGPRNEWRLRSGDWRVIMVLEEANVWVQHVDNRRDAY